MNGGDAAGERNVAVPQSYRYSKEGLACTQDIDDAHHASDA
jgi:hypothetical protein